MKMEPPAMKEHGKQVIKTARDPVCDMEVDDKSAPAKFGHMGKTYYFCAPGCNKTFDENPARYTEGAGHGMTGHRGYQM